MLKRYKKGFIPAALVCLGVEHAPGALPCQKSVNGKSCDKPYEINLEESQAIEGYEQNRPKLTIEELLKSHINKINKEKSRLKSKRDRRGRTKVLVKVRDEEIEKFDPRRMKVNQNFFRLTASDKVLTYIVKEGDTISSIEKRFRVPRRQIFLLNNLKRTSKLKAGQQLILPIKAIKVLEDYERERRRAEKSRKKMAPDAGFHIVKRGESLSLIAKKYNLNMKKLIKYNKLANNGHIRVGQKIYLYDRNGEFKIAKGRVKKVLKVTATAYTSHEDQTDSTPFLAAWNNHIRPGMKIIAVSRDLIKKHGLTNGVKVKIKGLPGVYTVRDKRIKDIKRESISIWA